MLTFVFPVLDFCRTQGIRAPNFQIISDRRGKVSPTAHHAVFPRRECPKDSADRHTAGGRTAWSCVITMQNTTFPARFWYDGQYVNNAREDAAEKALQALGVVPAPAAQQTTQGRQQQQQ